MDNEPIVARPPSRIYRFQKLIRRNRVTFTAIVAVIAALLFGLGLSTWLFLQERAAWKEQTRLREVSEHLLRAAEFRQKLTEANFAYNLNKIEEADGLVAGIPARSPIWNMPICIARWLTCMGPMVIGKQRLTGVRYWCK